MIYIYKNDLFRYFGKKTLNIKDIVNIILHHNLRFLFWLRLAEKGLFVPRIMCFLYSRRYGLEISAKADIGEGLYLGHAYNITVGDRCKIGRNVSLHKGCTIGSTSGENWGSPVIGNNVWIGINAVVVGKINIGDDVLIAPGAFVNHDVPSGSIVIGNPGTIHRKENATKYYIENKVQ